MQNSDTLIPLLFIQHITETTTKAFPNGFQQTDTGSAASRTYCHRVSSNIRHVLCFGRGGKKAALETNALILMGKHITGKTQLFTQTSKSSAVNMLTVIVSYTAV